MISLVWTGRPVCLGLADQFGVDRVISLPWTQCPVWSGKRSVYSGRRLTANTLDIDHCLPWHAWPCSDLWNLLPASSQLNRQKSDRVPSEVMLSGAQTRIQGWWAQAYDGVLGERFRLEAQASLPLVGGGAGVEEVYAGVRVQRLRLRFDLGVGEWG